MQTITLSARFDGERIVLDEPYRLEPGTQLMVTILPKADEEQEEWHRYSTQHLNRAYSDQEPDYTTAALITPNPDYAGR